MYNKLIALSTNDLECCMKLIKRQVVLNNYVVLDKSLP